jgi:hypothetical protein
MIGFEGEEEEGRRRLTNGERSLSRIFEDAHAGFYSEGRISSGHRARTPEPREAAPKSA